MACGFIDLSNGPGCRCSVRLQVDSIKSAEDYQTDISVTVLMKLIASQDRPKINPIAKVSVELGVCRRILSFLHEFNLCQGARI